MFTRKTYRRIKPMVIVLLFVTLVLAMSSASAADDGIADDAVTADAMDYSIDEVSASSDDVAIDTESSDIYSVDDATVTEDDASDEIITDTDSDAAISDDKAKAPLASNSGSEDTLGVGTQDVDIDLSQERLYGGDVCDFTITFSESDAEGTVTVTIIDTTVPEDTNRRTFVYTIPVVSGEAKASSATSITVNGADASFAEVLLWPEFRTEWDNGVQRFPDSVTIAYSGDDTYAPKTVEKSLTVYPFEAKMEIDITQGQGRENEITYGNPLGLVLFEVYNPFEFDNPLYGGNLNVYIVNGDEVDPDEFNPTTDIDKIIKKSVVHINDGDGSITFDDIFEEGYYLIGIYFDEINHPRYNVWEGFNIIKDTQVGPFVVSSNGLAYQTLEEALAVATEEDTITVIQEGVYKGIQNTGLLIEKSVTIAAAGNLAVTFDCEENNNFITVAANKVVNLKDIKIINGKATNGGAVNVLSGGKLSVNNVNFVNNLATKTGGAINAEDGSYVVIMRSNFTSNTANGENTFPSGGAVCIGDAFAAITSSVFTDNQGGNSAGAVYIGADNFLINDCTFVGNKANGGSAGALWVNGWTGKVEGCTFEANEARDFGGAIEWSVKEGTLVDSTFKDNKAAQGGAIHWSGIDGKIEGTNVFTGNEATQNGGAIFWEGTSGTVEGANFTSNKAGAAAHGNAIYWAGASGTVEDSIFDSNTGGAGAIIWLGEGGNIKGSYFANNGVNPDVFNIYKLANDLNIEANTFEISTATIKADKDEYTYGDSAIITGNFIWGVNNNPIGLIVDSTRGSTDIDFTVENFVNGPFTYELTNLLPGEYTVAIVDFTETAKNNKFIIAATALDDFIVNKAKADVTVTAETVTYPTQATVVVNANVPGTYTIRVGNKDYAVVVGDTGSGSVVIDQLAPGTYDVDLSADLGDNYESIAQIPATNLVVNAQTGPFVVASTGFGYATLAEALAHTTGSADTITVIEAGTYKGTQNTGLTIDQDVTIKADEGLEVIFDAEGNNNFLTIKSGKEVTLKDISVINGAADYGAGVYVEDGATLNVVNVNFKGNAATNKGGAIYALGKVDVTDSKFDSNDITYRTDGSIENGGAAIYAGANSELTITGSEFTNNLLNFNSNTDKVFGAVVAGNVATVTDSTFTNNAGRWGGALAAAGYIDQAHQGTLTVTDSTFTNNNAYQGGALFAQQSYLRISDSEFTGNTAVDGGAVLHDTATVTDVPGSEPIYDAEISNTKFDGNIATRYGSAIIALSPFKYTGVEFINNQANGGTSTVHYMGTTADSGFALDSIIDGCNFESNTANYYGAVYFYGTKSLTVMNSNFTSNTGNTHTGAILFQGNSLTVDNVIFTSNKGAYTGGIFIGAGTATIKNSVFDSNSGASNYFNIYQPTADTCTLENNVFKTISPTIDVAEDSYEYGEEIAVSGNFNWGVNRYAITLPITEANDLASKDIENFLAGNFAYTIEKLDAGTYTLGIETFKDANGNEYIVSAASDTFVVEKAEATITVDADKYEITYGETVELSSVVSPAGATGAVTYYVDDEPVDSAILTGLTGGEHTVYAKYAGDDNYETAVSEPITITVNKAVPTVTVSSNKDEVEYGETAELSNVIPADATGAVTYYVDGEAIEGSTLSDLAFGPHTVVAKFAGDDNYEAAESEPITVYGLPKKGTYTDLQYQIDKAISQAQEEGKPWGELSLEYDFEFDEEYDLANNRDFINGVVINDSIFIKGNGVEISGEEQARIFNLPTEADVQISSLYLSDGNAGDGYGGAIYSKSEDLQLYDILFSDNYAQKGGAIYVDGDNGFVMGSFLRFKNNEAEEEGGAVYVKANFKVQGEFSSNSAQYGGAIYVAEGAGVDVSFAKFETNEATSGSSIYLSEGSFAPNGISTCNFEMNGDGDGATVVIGADDVEIRHSNFTHNGGRSGSVYWTGDNGKLTDCNFTENQVMGTGSVVSALGDNFIIDSCNFDSNVARNDGIIYLEGNDAKLNKVTIQNNNAGKGAIVLNDATISIADSLFKDNIGEALNYNIYNQGTIESITGTTFETIKPTITMDDSFVFGEIIPVNGTFDWGVKSPEMTMNFTVNGAPMVATVLDGKFAMNIDTQPDVGAYTVVISTFTDAKGNTYVVDTVTKTFEVTKQTPIVEVNDTTAEWNTPVDIPVKVTDENGNPLTGSVIVTVDWRVDGVTQVVELDENGEGKATFRINQALGEMTITANYTGNDNYKSAKETATLTITGSSELSLEVTANEVTYGDETIITVTAEDGSGEKIGLTQANVTVDDGEVQLLPVGADGTINLGKLAAGEHKIVVSFVNEFYEEMASAETVAKVNPTGALIDATVANYAFDETGKLIISVTDLEDNVLNGTVAVEVDNELVGTDIPVVDGVAIVDLTGYAIGEHSVSAIFNNENYTNVEDVTHFNVTKKTPTINVEGDEYLMPGDSAAVTVTVKDGNKGINGTAIVTVDGTDYAVKIVDGEGELIIDGLFPEEYTIAAKFLETENYTEAVYSGDAVIDFLMHYANFDIVITNGTYGEQLTVTVDNVTNKEGDKLTGTVFGGIYDEEGTLVGQLAIQVSNGAGQETIATSCAGTLSATASFMDDDYEYGSETKNITVIVAKAQPTIAVTYENGNFTITLDGVNGEKLNETVTVAIDGTPVDIAARTDNGTFSFIDNGIAPGDHTVVVSFEGNRNYLGDFANLGFNVPKEIPVISVTGATVDYGQPATVKFTVSDADGLPVTTGSVIVTVDWLVDGETQVVELVEGSGEATFALAGVAPGTVNITVTYIENDKYASAVNDTENITIKDSTDLSLEATSNEVTYGGDTILNVVATDGKGAQIELSKVNITIDGVTTEYPVDEDGNVNIGKLPAGDTEITVSIDDEVYGHVETKVNATVSPAVPDLTVTPGEGNITIDVKDGETPLSGTATVVIDGDSEHPITVQIDETGHAVVPIDAAPGNHAVEVIFTNDNYTEARQTVAVTVPKITPIVYVNGTEVEYGTPATINITVTDEEGNLINGTVIVVASWEVDGETQVVELVDGKGEATFVLAGLGQGAYADINATYVENDNYTTAYNDTEIIKITPSTELTLDVTANEATFGEDTILTIVAKDGADAEVPLTKVNVTVDGVTNEYDVDENGNVNLGNLSIGDHEITVSVDDGFHEEATANLNATVKPAEANVTVTPGEGNVTVEAKDKDGNPINGTAIIVVDGGEPIEVPIDETGKIEYPIDAEPGAHTVEVTFTNPDYENVTKTVVVNVPKKEATLTIANSTEPVYGQNVTIVPTLVPADATGTITYYVDGSTAGTELAIGENFIVSGLTADEHTIVAKYNGDGNYSVAESNTLTLNVAKAPLTFEVVDAIAYYPDTGTINVAASADDTFTILVNGVEYSVTVENGKGSVKVNEVLDVGEYDITWNIPDGDNYIGTEGSAIYQVVPAAPDFSIIGSPEINYGQNNTIIPTITEGATGNITYTIDGVEIGKTGVNENFTVEGLDVGEYTIVATYSGDNNYGTVKANFTFKVLPIDVVVSVSSDEVYYPNTGSINLTASAPGEYTVLVGNKTYTATVTTPGETVTIPVTDLFEVGKYDINVTAPASQNYNALDTGAIGTYVVSKAKSVIAVTYDNATGKITVTLEGEEDHVKLSETISVEVDGVAISGAKTTDGVFVSEDLELTPGKHSVFAVFVGNENYLGSYAQLNLDIPKFGDAEVTVSAAPIKEGEDAIINITVKDGDKGLTGVVTVTLDGTNYAVDVTDGIGQLTVKNLVATTSPTTTYPITAKFNGNDEYAEATGTGEINVTDYNDVIIVIAGGEDGAVATLIDTDLNNITGKVNVTVDGVGPTEYDVVDGKVNIPISEEGDHEITVDFAGDETHPAASKTDTVYVGQNLIPTSLTVTVADIKYTEDAEVVVILKDEAGNLISGKVNITIGDASKVVTVTGGHASTKFSGLNANSYTVLAEFASDGTYASCVGTTPFTVKQLKTRIIARNMTTTAINVTEDGRIGQYFSWTLVDEKGRVLADKNVSIGFNANVYNRVTNASGQARLQINLQNSGPYTFAISFLGDENYEGCFEVVKIDVNKQKAQLTASGATYKASAKTKTLSATYKTKAGNPIVGKTVKFTVNGKTYSAKTDSKGVAKVNVSLTKAGSYTVEVKAPATNTYAETIKKVTLKLT